MAFRSDDPGQAALGEPVVEPANLPPLREPIVQQSQKRIDRIEHDSSGSSRIGLGLDSSQHSTQVKFAGLNHVRPHFGINEEELLLFQFRQVPPETCGVCQNVAGILFEGDEDARLAQLARPVDQCLQGENRFSAAGTAEDEGGSISRQTTAGDCIKSLDTSWHLVQTRNILIFRERSHNSFR